MKTTIIELELPPEQYERLMDVAHMRQLPMEEVAQAALAEWLEEQARLEDARKLMHELGQGLGQGPAPHDVARQHDAYLYSSARRGTS